ncbi:YqaJ viral recombinase family protein [Bacillus cytotoxicus]|uniref:YqaJ viral recombinase family nuclease n=1 Tax=Bacillus cytotoxicus TaxID=580165 RepID=UPI000863FD82|nr:YqaJ viral recombinase family protein [Bacillus cytotoxicus]MDH2862513.1 YqaJ viral recombinase family protein [Bacillus cytotoxicus]MDH2870280.1 YqaJ viral recombinase family protein [Bacillus cytotoxicus]MDH2873345.1 YqaJ viral recombinase family protein [Bacillus cytotoxicus]MDH2878586.1 YqaJ viral recombinase family protein [Bacillus cytotoxicus]MDH2893320.1 YqaJ viral recombinase family protein [Bacillus cytotoxicus]
MSKPYDVIARTTDLTREEWLEMRRQGIGGSDLAAVLNLSDWNSPMSLYLDKIGELKEKPQSEYAYWGNVLEDIVAREFVKRTGLKVRRKNEMLRSKKYPFMMANIDRELIGRKEGLECKTTSEYKRGEWKGDNVPTQYRLQCQHYMAVTGYKRWHIAVLIGGNKFEFKTIERDEDIIKMAIEKCDVFWNNFVAKRIPPAVDGLKPTTDSLKEIYEKSIEDDYIILPSHSLTYAEDFETAGEQLKYWKERQDKAKNNMINILKCSEKGIHERFEVTYKTNARGSRTFKLKMKEVAK